MEILLLLVAGLFAVLFLPLLLLALLVKTAAALLLLPFRVLGALVKVALFALFAIGGGLLVLGALVVLPLFPLILLGLLIWAVVRPARPPLPAAR